MGNEMSDEKKAKGKPKQQVARNVPDGEAIKSEEDDQTGSYLCTLRLFALKVPRLDSNWNARFGSNSRILNHFIKTKPQSNIVEVRVILSRLKEIQGRAGSILKILVDTPPGLMRRIHWC